MQHEIYLNLIKRKNNHIDRHRSAEVAKALFGEDFDGTLVRDRYAAYNGNGRDWQTCLAHIITKAKEISREQALLPPSEMDAAAGPFCERPFELAQYLWMGGAGRLMEKEAFFLALQRILSSFPRASIGNPAIFNAFWIPEPAPYLIRGQARNDGKNTIKLRFF